MNPTQAEMIAALRPAFLSNRVADLAKMRTAMASGDYKVIQTIGHNCKGIGAGYGFPDITAAGAAIEAAARELDSAKLEESIRRFEDCIAAAETENAAIAPLSDDGVPR